MPNNTPRKKTNKALTCISAFSIVLITFAGLVSSVTAANVIKAKLNTMNGHAVSVFTGSANNIKSQQSVSELISTQSEFQQTYFNTSKRDHALRQQFVNAELDKAEYHCEKNRVNYCLELVARANKVLTHHSRQLSDAELSQHSSNQSDLMAGM